MKIKKSAFLLLPLAVLVPPIAIVSCSSNSDSNQEISKELYDPAGGNINNLKVDKYLNVVKKLGINSDTKLTTLSNEGLSQKIQKYDSGAQVEIISGSTADGVLNLKLIKGNNEEISIKIEGFQKQSSVVFTYSNFEINEQKWVENLLSVQTSDDLVSLESVTSEVWTKVIKNFKIQIDDADSLANIENSSYKKLLSEGVQFSFSAKTTNSTSNLKMKVDAIIPAMIYQNGSWVPDKNNQDQIEQLQPDATNLIIPTLDIAKKYVVEQTFVDESVLPTFYPSALQAAIEFHKKKKTNFIWDNLVKNDLIKNASNNEIMKKYFKSKTLKLAFDLDDFNANDWTNALGFSIKLMIDNSESGFKTSLFKFTNKNKQISDLLQNWELNPTIIKLKDSSAILEKILKGLKENTYTSSKIDDYFKGIEMGEEDREALINYDEIIDDNFKKPIYEHGSSQSDSDHKSLINKIKEHFELKFLNNPLNFNYNNGLANPSNNELMFLTGLFNWNNNIFLLKKIDLIVMSQSFGGKDSISVKIWPGQDNTKVKLTFNAKFIAKFSEDVEKKFWTLFEYEFDQNTWNNIQVTP